MQRNNESNAGVNKLVKRNFRTQKWKNALLFFIIFMITCFFTCFSILKYNEYKNLERFARHMNGTCGQVLFRGLTEKEAGKIRASQQCSWAGESIFVSKVVNQELSNQYTEMRWADDNYAKSCYAEPTKGTMPVKADEIAVGIRTLKKLGVPAKLNETVSILWIKDGKKWSRDFKLAGYWKEDAEVKSNYIWVGKEFAQEYSAERDAIVSFEGKNDLDLMAEALASEAGVEKEKYTVMYINRNHILEEVLLNFQNVTILGVVFLISTLILNSIQQISIVGNATFYGRIKAMGAEEKQIRRIIWFEVLIIGAMTIPAGLFCGYIAGTRLTPVFVNGSLGYTQIYYDFRVLVIPFIFTVFTVVAANIRPALLAGKTDIEKAFKYKGYGEDERRGGKKYPSIPVLLQMSMDNIARYKKRTVIGITMLIVGLVWISCFYVIHIGFDRSKYLAAVSISDFEINSGDLSQNSVGNREFFHYVREVQKMEGVTDSGLLYLQREQRTVPDDVYKNIRNYYESNENERLKYMEYDPLWMEEYKALQDSHICRHQIWGIDGLLIDEIMQPQYLINGYFDAEAFRSGKYAIVQGISGDQGTGETEPAYLVGDMINIEGEKFEVMAVAEIPHAVNQGVNSAVSGFELSFYISGDQFQDLYAEIYPQKIFFNTSPYIKENTEKILEEIERDMGFSFISEQRLIEQYNKDVVSQNGIEMLIGYALLAIGLIQRINSTASSIINRKKEFALMNHIGMTWKQIRCMLVLESVICIFIALVFAYAISLSCITTFIKKYISGYWASTFNFSITPLLILTPFLIVFAILVPMIVSQFQHQDIISQKRG